jgi:hypothetical protein
MAAWFWKRFFLHFWALLCKIMELDWVVFWFPSYLWFHKHVRLESFLTMVAPNSEWGWNQSCSQQMDLQGCLSNPGRCFCD